MIDYRIDDLARAAGTTVRNVRAYQDRGLLPPPRRQGRVALYNDSHLARLRMIGELLERGYSLSSIKDLAAAWDTGKSLGAVLGVVPEITRPWSDEAPEHLSFQALTAMFEGATLEDVAAAVAVGLLVPEGDGFRVTSPSELSIGAELKAAGVPLKDTITELRQLRADMERIAGRFIALTATHVWEPYVNAEDAPEAELTELVRRLRPLAQAAVDVELARAMHLKATHYVEELITRMVEEPPERSS